MIALDSLGRLPALAAGEWEPERPRPLPLRARARRAAPDLADLRGQPHLRHALEVAAAGGHSLLMIGPPGAGKSLAASRLPSILPPLASVEALEVARIASACGRLERDAAGRAAVPRAAPHDQPGRADRRRHPAAPGRGDAGPPRRPLPRRALRVPPRRAGGAAGAAGGGRGLDRPGRQPPQPALPLHAGRRRQPVSLRSRRSRPRLQLRAGRRAALPGAAQRRPRRPHRHPRRRPPAERGRDRRRAGGALGGREGAGVGRPRSGRSGAWARVAAMPR